MPVIAPETIRLRHEMQAARAESDRLFSILTREALYDRPIDQRHRVIFYLGHLDGFDSIQICREGLSIKSPDPTLDDLFQAGIDPDPGQLPSDQPKDWPAIDEVREYVARARRRVDEHIEDAPEDVVHMALEHRLMHLETLAYMFHNFDYSRKQGGPAGRGTSGTSLLNEWRDVPGGEAILGKQHDDSFGWDNEFEQTQQYVSAFRMQKYNVSNGDYLRFVKDGAPAPNFWTQTGSGFRYRGMFEETPLPLDWPVYVTESEAEAYARWMGKHLATEEQFHRAAYGTPSGGQNLYPWGNAEPLRSHGNFDFKQWDPEPVTATPAGDSAFGISQLIGNGWEWTRTVFGPLPGFKARPSYPGYSANFFDGEHNVIKGGSQRTAARLLRRSFRNWFRRDYPYVYATFRCVEN